MIGSVINVFHSRLHGAWADVSREPPEADEATEPAQPPSGDRGRALAFVRPHDIHIESAPIAGGIEATVQDLHTIGPLVRVELAHASELVEVELTRERADALRLQKGQRAWLKPRQVKVFQVPDEALEEGGSGI
ncbi:MAG: TOBE-like domain-containing protein [Candidatus Accumulibacter sp.]|nr:TOBE-like domain-containing protein [Accumulibacter sp.]